MGFAGDLKDLSLADLLQSAQANRHTGTLSLVGEGKGRDLLFLDAGMIAAIAPADGGPVGGFAEVLARTRAVSEKELERALKRKGRKLLRTILSELSVLPVADYKAAAEGYLRDAAADLFLRAKGRFEFKEGDPERGLFDPDLIAAQAAVDVTGVIMEGGRRIDEWGRLSRRIGGGDEIWVPTEAGKALLESEAQGGEAPADAEGGPSAEARELLELLDGRRSLDACVAALPFGRFRTLELLGSLIDARLARLSSPEELQGLAEAEAARGADPLEVIAHYRRALESARNALPLREKLAILLERVGRREEAAQERKLLGLGRATAGELASAVEEYRRAGDLTPTDPLPLERVLELLRQRKERDPAAELQAAYRLGERYVAIGLTEKARALYAGLLAERPADADVAERLADVLERMGDRREAAAVWRRVGRERERRGERESALSGYQRAVRMDPADEESRKRAQEIETGRDVARRARIRRALTIAGTTAAVLALLFVVARESFARRALRDAHLAGPLALSAAEDRTLWIQEYRKVARSWPWSLAGNEARTLVEGLVRYERDRADDLERRGAAAAAITIRAKVAAVEKGE